MSIELKIYLLKKYFRRSLELLKILYVILIKKERVIIMIEKIHRLINLIYTNIFEKLIQ